MVTFFCCFQSTTDNLKSLQFCDWRWIQQTDVQRRKPTVFLHSWLHSKAVQRRQSHRSWDPYENTYSTNFAHISQDDCKQAEQDCTIRRNRNLAANRSVYSKSTPTPACVCCNKSYQPGASPPLYQGNFCFICLYYWLLMFLKGRLIPVLLMEWLCCWFSEALHTRWGLLRAGLSLLPALPSHRTCSTQLVCPSPPSSCSTEPWGWVWARQSAPKNQHRMVGDESSSSEQNALVITAQHLPARDSITISARTQTSFLHWERDKKRQLDPS